MKYVQSFYPYRVFFSSIEKEIPSKNDTGNIRNLAEITDDEYERLQTAEPLFRALVNEKKYRVLDKMPESYKPPATLVNEARELAGRMAQENAELKAKLELKASKGFDSSVIETEGEAETNLKNEVEAKSSPATENVQNPDSGDKNPVADKLKGGK